MASGVDNSLNKVKAMQQQQKRAQKMEKERSRLLPSHHQLHRSTVRPFFCCGSQLSINSITDIKDMTVQKDKVIDDDYEDLSDSNEFLENMEAIDLCHVENKQDRCGRRSAHLVNSKRKKNLVEHDKAINRKKFWSTKLSVKFKSSNKKSQYASESELGLQAHDDKVCARTACRSSTLEASEQAQAGGFPGNWLGVPMATTHHILPGTSSDFGIDVGEDNINGNSRDRARVASRLNAPLPFINNLNELYPVNDIDEQLIAQRRFEMEHGIELGENGDAVWLHQSKLYHTQDQGNGPGPSGQYPSYGALGLCSSESLSNALGTSVNMQELSWSRLSLNMTPVAANVPRPLSGIHTQVDYKHYLVPDLHKIINSSFYWGVMDRYQAEKLIENKAEGTFLLRDSAQDEYLFSVSFRRYGRSLHARIEQWNHRFSFDSRDPGVFATYSVCGLMEHYKDPSSCMFFEPMLTLPLHRTYPFPLQHLTRAAICSNITYDGISKLNLPASLKEYLRFYHYKQKVRVRRFDYVP